MPGRAHFDAEGLASFERAMTQPSLFESTTTGLPRSRG
jgi:hypothetical protein